MAYYYKSELGLAQPEVEYTFDLPMPSSLRPEPVDGEAESFALLPFSDVLQLMRQGEFKPNCALCLLDFFIRKGKVTPESDTRYLELCTRMRRTLSLPAPA